jgi:hypothetical protein
MAVPPMTIAPQKYSECHRLDAKLGSVAVNSAR